MESRPGGILLKEDDANVGPGSPAPGSSGTFFPTHTPFGLNPSLSTVPDLGTLLQFSNKLQFPCLQTRMASLPCVMLQRSDEPPDTPAQHTLRRRQPPSTSRLFHSPPIRREPESDGFLLPHREPRETGHGMGALCAWIFEGLGVF